MRKIIKYIITSLFALFMFQKNMLKPSFMNLNAASTDKYILNLDYTKTYNQYGMKEPYTTTDSGTTLEFGNYNTRTLKVFIYGSSHSSNVVTANSGHIFNFNDMTIAIETDYSIQRKNVIASYSIRNANGTIVASSTTESQPSILYSGNLEDGTYFMDFVWDVADYMLTQPNYTQSYGTFNCRYSFVIDSEAPTIIGASVIVNRMYKNANFIVSALDNGSGIEAFYMREPNSSNYVLLNSTTKEVSKTNGDGLYRFYAKDKAGNTSPIYYVALDTKVPTGKIISESGKELCDYTNESFSFQPEDTLMIQKMEYLLPNTENWLTYTGRVISNTEAEGTYQFRMITKSGTISEIYSICLDNTLPIGELYKIKGSEALLITKESAVSGNAIMYLAKDSISGIKRVYVKTPNGSYFRECENQRRFIEEGTYYFCCMDNAGNRSQSIMLILDNTIPVVECSGGKFFETTTQPFQVTASDANGVTLFYKGPNMSEFVSVDSNCYDFTKDVYCLDGRYSFYAEDSAGLRSEIYWIDVNLPNPSAEIIRSEVDNSVKVTWEGNGSALLNGELYQKGTWITKEGTYTLLLYNHFRSKEFYFDIDHYYIEQDSNFSCTEGGYITYICVHCQDTYQSEYQEPVGHCYEETIFPPTCIEDGYSIFHCKNCDSEYRANEKKATGHHLEEVTLSATCTESGGVYQKCIDCEFQYLVEEIYPSGHSYSSVIEKEPDCTHEGIRHYTCEKCGHHYTSVIPPMNHEYQITDIQKDKNTTIRIYTCTHCGDTFEQNIGDSYEKVTNYVEYLFIQYSSYMVWVFLATSGVWSIGMGVAIIIAHKNEEKEKAKKMVVNYVIGLVVIFALLVACPYIIRGIASLF